MNRVATAGAVVVIGHAITFLARHTIASVLYDLYPNDPATLALVAVVLIVTALIAGLIPAYRASVTQPAIALRAD